MEQSALKDKIEKIIRETLSEKGDKSKNDEKLVPLEASGRHVHLCQSDIEKLFGKNSLTPKRE
ncbi:MAG: PduL/EutD family phosphate acyltransferase, partial [bacterium]